MKAIDFYEICDGAEAIQENITEGYYPTVEEIDNNISIYGLEDQVPLLAYYASNPFKRMNDPAQDDIEYLDIVKYSKKLLQQIELTGVVPDDF